MGEGEDAADVDAALSTNAEMLSAGIDTQPASPAANGQGSSESAAVTPEKQQHMPPAAAAAAGSFNSADVTTAEPGVSVSPAPKPAKSSSGSLSERLLIPAEEEAFLRSLGWEGDELDDDNEEGDCPVLFLTTKIIIASYTPAVGLNHQVYAKEGLPQMGNGSAVFFGISIGN